MDPLRRHSTASADRVWEVLADGWTYPLWVVGASRMRAVSADWPQPGARLHHSAGLWPAVVDDETSVEDCEPGRRLLLRAKGRPFGQAVVELVVEPDGEGSVVCIREDVSSGPATLVPEVLRQRAVLARNQETLHRLLLLAERPTEP